MIDERFVRTSLRFEPPLGGFERLVHRRDRKHRNQRVRAAVMAIAIVALLVVALARVDAERLTPANTPSPSITERWVRPTAQGPKGNSVAVASVGGNVYVLSLEGPDQFVTALDGDGHQIWRSRSAHENSGPGEIAADATGVYVAGSTLRKYDLLDGHQVWGQHLPQVSWSYGPWIALDGSGIYVFASTGTLQKFDRDGRILWSIDVGGSPKALGEGDGLVAAPTGGVYLALFEQHGSGGAHHCGKACHYRLLHIDPDGNELWSTELKDPSYYGPYIHLAADPNGIYVLTNAEACRSWPPYSQNPGGPGATNQGNGCVFRLDAQGQVAPGWPVRLIGGRYRGGVPRGTWWGDGGLVAEEVGVLVVGGGSFNATVATPLEVNLLKADGTRSWAGSIRLGRGLGNPFLSGMTTSGDDLFIAGERVHRHPLASTGYVAGLKLSGFGGTSR